MEGGSRLEGKLRKETKEVERRGPGHLESWSQSQRSPRFLGAGPILASLWPTLVVGWPLPKWSLGCRASNRDPWPSMFPVVEIRILIFMASTDVTRRSPRKACKANKHLTWWPAALGEGRAASADRAAAPVLLSCEHTLREEELGPSLLSSEPQFNSRFTDLWISEHEYPFSASPWPSSLYVRTAHVRELIFEIFLDSF